MVTMYNEYGYTFFVLAGKNKCVMGGGGGLSRILRKCYRSPRIDERVGYHCPRLMMNILIQHILNQKHAWKH